MKNRYITIATILFLLNITAIFYLNFTQQLSFIAQLFILPWLTIQSLFLLFLTYATQGKYS